MYGVGVDGDLCGVWQGENAEDHGSLELIQKWNIDSQWYSGMPVGIIFD